MKKLHLCLLFSLAIFTASSQKVYFIYIQTESEQPFFVKMNEKVQSSTASGYIILAKLVDSTYSFSIGFPQNKWSEQNFSVTVSKKDHGFLLKNFNEKGWGLFDLQTLTVQMAITGKASLEEIPKTENKDVSVFTEILSKAADDPSLKEKPVSPKGEVKKTEALVQEVVKKEEPKTEIKDVAVKPIETIEQPMVRKEETKAEVKEELIPKPVVVIEQPIIKQQNVQIENKEQSTVLSEEAKTVGSELLKVSQIRKWSESSTTEGFGLVFIEDYENGTKDTIRVVIPNPKPVVDMVSSTEPLKEEKKFLNINSQSSNQKEDTIAKENLVVELGDKKSILKNNCNEMATESDFFKLRKKMAATNNDGEMIGEAKKYFKVKCFSTEQIKNLGNLFLTDAGKYEFYDASYLSVSDIENFSILEIQLNDEYYITRFKAMLRN